MPPARPPPVPADAADPARSVALGLAAMPGGALVGTVVHSVFEHTDSTRPTWRQRSATRWNAR